MAVSAGVENLIVDSSQSQMKKEERMELLNLLNWERQTVVYPGVTRQSDTGVIKEMAADGKSCEVVYSSCSEMDVDVVIKHQIEMSRRGRYDLEWKLYGHDRPHCLGERLSAAGLQAGDRESFMVLPAKDASLERFGTVECDIRRVTDRRGLRDYQLIMPERIGRGREADTERYAVTLENYPDNMSVYVAYVNGEPAACGRIYFHTDSRFAGLYGGNTREQFRKRGLFTQLVAARIREAVDRGVAYVCVDALPTSEPILGKRGFEIVTYTQPYFFSV